jgi:hypothetical protein
VKEFGHKQRLVAVDAHAAPSSPRPVGQNPNWTWYCDDSGRPTYTELGTDGAWGLVVPYPDKSQGMDGKFSYIALSAHVSIGDPNGLSNTILWRMSKEYGEARMPGRRSARIYGLRKRSSGMTPTHKRRQIVTADD